MKNYVRNEKDLTVTITLSEEEFSNHFCECSDCGQLLFIDEAVLINGEYYCPEHTTTCIHCGTVIPIQESYQTSDGDYDYCHDCFIEQTWRCSECNARFRYVENLHEVNELWYCDSCYEHLKPIIQPYHTMKDSSSLHFYGEEKRNASIFIGCEIEIDSNEHFDREEIAAELQRRFGDFFAYENDGSLRNGFEMISQPASLSYHVSMMPKYKDAFRYLISNGIRSHDIGTAGLHCHIDRQYFENKEDSSIAKLLYIFEKFRPELMRFSRRTESQVNDWARFRKHVDSNKGWIKKTIKDSKGYQDHGMRYFAINLTNDNTVEIRLFRGTLNIETFEATLKFTARLAEICKTVSAVELAKYSFEDLLGDDSTVLSYWNRVKERVTNRQEEF